MLLILVIKSFVSDPGIQGFFCLLLASMKLWHANLLACKWVKSQTLYGSSFCSHYNKDLFRQESSIDAESSGEIGKK